MSVAVVGPEISPIDGVAAPSAERPDPTLDAAAAEMLVACRRTAYIAALQLLGNPDDALDLAQEAMVRLLRSLPSLDPDRSWRPYLMRVVANLARDLWRRRRHRRAESLETLIEERGFDAVDPGARPDERAHQGELSRRAARALATLSGPHREILVLRDYQGLAYAEIAAALGIPRGTVMSRLHKARQLLREAVLQGGRTP